MYIFNDKENYRFSTPINSDVMKERVEKLIQNKPLKEKITIVDVIDSINADLDYSSCSVQDTRLDD